jgi:hypothetical protein
LDNDLLVRSAGHGDRHRRQYDFATIVLDLHEAADRAPPKRLGGGTRSGTE